MISIGQKLRALFSLPVTCFTGHSQRSDYNKLCKQYPVFNLPRNKALFSRMDDVELMSVNRGLATRGHGKTTLQALCRGQKMHLKKPKHVRVGTCFDSKGSLSQEAKLYCQMDVEAPLILHSIYSAFPDLTKRVRKNERLELGTVVDIMPESATAIHPIAQGTVTQLGGSSWLPSGGRLKKTQVLVKVEKVFNKKGVIHYPGDKTNPRKCACKQTTHVTVGDTCDFYMYSQLGKPDFVVKEFKTRLRRMNEMISYPPCVYETEEPNEEQDTSNFMRRVDTEPNENEEVPDELSVADDSSCRDEGEEFGTSLPSLPDELFRDDEVDEDEAKPNEVDATPAQVDRASDVSFNEVLEKLIADADALAKEIETQYEEEDLPPEELHRLSTLRKVLADAFHLMDRAKCPMHHEYKALYFRALRAAMFVMNEEDVADVKRVLESKPGESWEKKLAFDFPYIAARVRRRIPPPEMLYHRLKAVFDFFKDKRDSETNDPLFNTRNQNKFLNMLEIVRKGYASDPTHMSMYVPKTNAYGQNMKDRDGLQLYRSIRGTSNLESLHQYLTTSFDHTTAGPWYSDMVLAIVRHHYNWRMSRKNRPGFPPLSHYNGLLIDRVNNLYESIYGYPKYPQWKSFNENLPLQSAYGIVAIDQERTSSVNASEADVAAISKSKTLKYLAD